ncbi:MAG TPA: FAD-dependent oxidoreductase [Sedimenticola thiotaurini]|uniref:FAD-dependent oxidoreductase n=1 Tax=Sedimenticola thiotaurini TaxID=1543721 RepID=A0A831W6J7_9GAMM|nr:FAD-dependent oxidoreductase [Sedimenticola thiotaurini]
MSTGIPYAEALARYRPLPERPPAEESVPPEELLSRFHPDHYEGSIVTLKVGPNKGDKCHRQLADLLQADARIDEADLAAAPVRETDVLVIGGGGAGCAAALVASRAGARVTLATKLRLGDSNTVMAEGGIQASIERDDTPQAHLDDTLRAGHYHADRSLVARMVMDGPEVIRWLIQQGMQFDLDRFGDILLRRAGGTSANRVAYYRDYTGLEMMRVLRESVANTNVEVMDYSPAVELLSDDVGHCGGAVLFSLKNCRYTLIKAKSVIIATGGIGRVHINRFPTSNHFGATGDGLVLAYRLGARLRDLDSFQYHPSGLAHPQHLAGTLITEGVRSAGAWMLNAHGERFVDELKSRDHVSSAILRECAEGRAVRVDDDAEGIWLDTPGLELRNPGILQARFPKLVQLGRRCHIDLSTTPILIYPTLHYQNGGVVIDEFGRTSVPGLYCIGEVSGGIHGKNRIMGNALLEIISFGRRAGAHAAENSHHRGPKKISLEHISNLRRELTLAGMPMEPKGPMLFPEYAKFEVDTDYDGLRRN